MLKEKATDYLDALHEALVLARTIPDNKRRAVRVYELKTRISTIGCLLGQQECLDRPRASVLIRELSL